MSEAPAYATAPGPSFTATGCALLRKLITLDECREQIRRVDAVAALASDPLMSRTGNELFPLRWDSEIVSPVLQSEDCLARIGAASAATDLRFISAYVSLKRPRTAALGWHQDWWCWHHPISRLARAPQIAVICYLQDTPAQSGALRVLPGSHRTWTKLHGVIPEAHSAEARSLPEHHPAMASVPGEHLLPTEAGDAVVLDYRLLHGTDPNITSRRRDAVLMSFVPDWKRLPTEVQAHLALHPALPSPEERSRNASPVGLQIFPAFEGPSRSLELNRVPAFAQKLPIGCAIDQGENGWVNGTRNIIFGQDQGDEQRRIQL